MQKIEFNIYRVKIIKPQEPELFPEDKERKDLFLDAINEKKSIELRRGNRWHIGNIKYFDNYQGYFAVGRTTKSINEKYDEDKGEFLEEQYETSPYTHVLFDSNIGVIAIGKKTRLSPTVGGIAKRISSIMNMSNAIKSRGHLISIDYIPDPTDFLSSLRSAYAIKTYTISFSRPNPFDAEEYFQKPMENILQEAAGDKGTAKISGEQLDPDVLVELSKSAAATGNDAKAYVQTTVKKRPTLKYLKGNPAKFSIDENDASEKKALDEALRLYQEIRS